MSPVRPFAQDGAVPACAELSGLPCLADFNRGYHYVNYRLGACMVVDLDSVSAATFAREDAARA